MAGWASLRSAAAGMTRSGPTTVRSRGCMPARSRSSSRARSCGVGTPAAASAWSRQLQAVQSIAAQLTRLSTVASIGDAICTETRQVVPYDNARVHVLAADGETLEAVAFSHHSPEYAGETADTLRLRVGRGHHGLGRRTRARRSSCPDASRHPRAVPVPGTPLIQEQMLLVPLRYEGLARGAIVLSRVGTRRLLG